MLASLFTAGVMRLNGPFGERAGGGHTQSTGGAEATERGDGRLGGRGAGRPGGRGGRGGGDELGVGWDTRASTPVLVVHCGLRFCLRRRGLGVALDRVSAELCARNELWEAQATEDGYSMQRAGSRRGRSSYHRRCTKRGCAVHVAGSGYPWAMEGPGGAPAAQTPADLGRPARSAARRSPARVRGGGSAWYGEAVKLSASVADGLYRHCRAGAARSRAQGTRAAARDAHRHGRGDLAVDGGLDSFHWGLVQSLGVRDGGGHLVQWRLLTTSRCLMTVGGEAGLATGCGNNHCEIAPVITAPATGLSATAVVWKEGKRGQSTLGQVD